MSVVPGASKEEAKKEGCKKRGAHKETEDGDNRTAQQQSGSRARARQQKKQQQSTQLAQPQAQVGEVEAAATEGTIAARRNQGSVQAEGAGGADTDRLSRANEKLTARVKELAAQVQLTAAAGAKNRKYRDAV